MIKHHNEFCNVYFINHMCYVNYIKIIFITLFIIWKISHTIFYTKVKYFLFLIINGNPLCKTKIQSPADILHNNTQLNLPNDVTIFLINCEKNNNIINRTQMEQIQTILLEKFRLV